ncbi:hypothetical protein D3C73_1058930 [compost metagenome]
MISLLVDKMCIKLGISRREFSIFTQKGGNQPDLIAFFQLALAKKQKSSAS